jgi:hypothetical protein
MPVAQRFVASHSHTAGWEAHEAHSQKGNKICGHTCGCVNPEDCQFNPSGAAPATSSRHQENAEPEKKYPIGGYAPGNYQCICATCDKQFIGDKRAVQCEACATAPQPPGFDLATDDVEKLLSQCLKPKEISGVAAVQLDRIKELMHWFRRFADGNANPKWFRAHAFELAYYIATTAGNRFIDLEAVRREAWIEGVNITPNARAIAETLGLITTSSQPVMPRLATGERGVLAGYDNNTSAPQLFTREQMKQLFKDALDFGQSYSFTEIGFDEYMNTNYPQK